MSYILDALRKAEAERERGHVPSIHAQTVFPSATQPSTARAPRWGLWVAIGTVVLLLAAALAWWLLAVSASRGVSPAATAAPTAPITTAPIATTTTTNNAPAPATAAPVEATRPAPAPVAAAPKPKPAAAPAATATKPAVAPAPDAATGPLTGKVYALAELPDDIRRQLPAVNIGGSMYSPVRANRILIVNGQVLHEGEKITPELVLEQVRVKGAILVFKGYRYSIAF